MRIRLDILKVAKKKVEERRKKLEELGVNDERVSVSVENIKRLEESVSEDD